METDNHRIRLTGLQIQAMGFTVGFSSHSQAGRMSVVWEIQRTPRHRNRSTKRRYCSVYKGEELGRIAATISDAYKD